MNEPRTIQPGEARETGALYPRLLHLQSIAPGALVRALLVEGVGVVAAVLVLADIASAWTLLALPVTVAAMVKLHDVIESALTRSAEPPRPVVEELSA